MAILTLVIIVLVVLSLLCAFAWYTIVPSSEAHYVIYGSGGSKVFSADKKFQTPGAGSAYFLIPEYFPIIGRLSRSIDVTIKELIFSQETYEKDQARYMVKSSTKYRITDVRKAAESFTKEDELKSQLKEIIQAAVREVTVKYDVVNARAKKQLMSEEVEKSIKDDLAQWGIELVNFVLVDFQDTDESSIVSDISKRREVEIQSNTREQNAEKLKQARIKEAEADEKAQEREIARDKIVAERKQQAAQAVSEKQKLAEEKRLEVTKVQVVKQAEIHKEAAIVKAKEEKATQEILKDKKRLEGEGDRIKAEQIAKGNAADIREKILAEAEGKEKLQAALNKFTPAAITALTAELAIEANKAVGIKGAEALAQSDMKVFAGSDGGQGFDIGKVLEATRVSSPETANAIENKIARPNDLGVVALKKVEDLKKEKKSEYKPSKEEGVSSKGEK